MDDDLGERLSHTTPDPALDEALALLQDRTVRATLYYLSAEPTTTLDEVAAVVAGQTATDDETITNAADYTGIRLRLYHAVLPKLAHRGYLRFDHETGTVSRITIPSVVETLLEQEG